MIQLFHVNTIVEEFEGYRNVCLCWWMKRREVPLDLPHAEMIKDYDPQAEREYACPEAVLQERFTKDEANALLAYLDTIEGGKNTIEPAPIPIEGNTMPVSAIPLGGLQGSIEIHERRDYALPFKVEGYYDLRHHERSKITAAVEQRPADQGGLRRMGRDARGGRQDHRHRDLRAWRMEGVRC
jgi:hypothetical protein